MITPDAIQSLFANVAPALATLLCCIIIIAYLNSLGLKSASFRLLGIICLVAGAVSAISIMESFNGSMGFKRFLFPFSFFILPLSIHLSHEIKGLRPKEHVLDVLYGLAVLLVAGSWWNSSLAVVVFPLLASAGVLGCAYLLDLSPSSKRYSGRSPGSWLVFAGTGGLLLLISLTLLRPEGIRPLSFSFIPVALLVLGVAKCKKDSGSDSITEEGVFRWLAASGLLLPLLFDLMAIALYWDHLTLGKYLSDILSFGLAKILAAVVCMSMGLFIFTRKTDHASNTLLSAGCMLLAIFNLKDAIIPLLPSQLALQVDLFHNAFTAFVIGISIHLVYRIAHRHGKAAVAAGYAASSMLAVFLALHPVFFPQMHEYRIAPLYQVWRTVLMEAVLLAFGYCALILWRVFRAETEPHRKEGLKIFFIGSALGVGLQALNLLSTMGIVSTHINTLLVVPLMLIVYGLTYNDLLNMSITSRRKMLSLGLKAILIVAYIAISPVIIWLVKEYGMAYVLSRIVPYGIPPLLSFVCAAFLSLFVLGLEQNRTEAILFSVINFCYALLNLDILLVAIIPDIGLALKISRLDHFFLSLIMLGVNLHLVYLVVGMKAKWWVVYASYLAGLVMAPLSQTQYYYQGMYTYYWGYFAHKAILFDVMSGLWLAGLIYGIFLLYQEFRKTEAAQRAKVRKVLTAFFIMAALSMSNIPTINGYEIYPMGTFAFVGLTYLAYGLFKFNMRHALQHVRSVLLTGCMIVLLLGIGLLPGRMLGLDEVPMAMLAGVLGVVLLIQPARRTVNTVIDLFIANERDALNEEYVRFTEELSRTYHLREIYEALRGWSFRVFSCTFITFLVQKTGDDAFHGWNTWNVYISEGLFRKSDEVPRGEQQLHIEPGNFIACMAEKISQMTSGDVLSKAISEAVPSDRDQDMFGYAEIMLPISLGEESRALLIMGAKNDGSGYRASEIESIQSAALVLGPNIENALLLESLEEQVDKRTSDLNSALTEAMIKEKGIIERNSVIERQNQIMAALLETTSTMRGIAGLEELFSYTLSQLKGLFPDFCGGIILEDPQRNILEASSFMGFSNAQQKAVLDLRARFSEPGIDSVLTLDMDRPGYPEGAACKGPWALLPLQASGEKASGYMVLREGDLDGQTGETIRLFMTQISAVVQNRLLLIHLERMASTDGLTGVYNRSFLDHELGKAIKHAKRFRNISFSLMIIDVNGLKQINDTYGHGVGDEVIVKVSGMLKAACRQTDIISRIGGDEFAVLMPATSRPQAEMLFSRIRQGEKALRVLLTPSKGAHINIPIRISIGLASSDESDPDDVMKKADDLMYLDKQSYYQRVAR